MVQTDQDIDNLPPDERLKVLRALQEKKKKELKELEDQTEKEVLQAQSDIERTIDELAQQEELALKEAKEQQHFASTQSLEESVVDAPPMPQGVVSYENPLARTVGSLVELTDYSVYEAVKKIEDKGYVSAQEQRLIDSFRSQASQITSQYSRQEIIDMDSNRGNYLCRTQDVLKRMDRRLHDLNFRGDDLGHVYK